MWKLGQELTAEVPDLATIRALWSPWLVKLILSATQLQHFRQRLRVSQPVNRGDHDQRPPRQTAFLNELPVVGERDHVVVARIRSKVTPGVFGLFIHWKRSRWKPLAG